MTPPVSPSPSRESESLPTREAVRAFQDACRRRLGERRALAENLFRRTEDYLWRLHMPEMIDRLLANMETTGALRDMAAASWTTRWMPLRLYKFFVRKLGAPIAAPYTQAVMLNFNHLLSQVALDAMSEMDLRYGAMDHSVATVDDAGRLEDSDDDLDAGADSTAADADDDGDDRA